MKDNDFYPIRLQAYMAKCGVGSRRACEELIREGHVMVNNKVIREMGVKVGPDDVVQVDTERKTYPFLVDGSPSVPQAVIVPADKGLGV